MLSVLTLEIVDKWFVTHYRLQADLGVSQLSQSSHISSCAPAVEMITSEGDEGPAQLRSQKLASA